MKRHNRTAGTICCALGFLLLGCAQQQPAPDTRAADEQAIRELEAAWSKAAGEKQLDATVSYYADDAAVFPPNAPIATSKEAIRTAWTQLLAPSISSLGWQTVKVEIARSGDLGYAYGTYEMTVTDSKGNPAKDRGKYVSVWKKQADGSWKSVADIFNSDLPAAPPAM